MIQISKNVSLKLDFEPQQTPNGNWIRLSGIRKSGVEKWINGAYKSHWIYSFINIETDKIIEFEFGYNDEFLKIIQ